MRGRRSGGGSSASRNRAASAGSRRRRASRRRRGARSSRPQLLEDDRIDPLDALDALFQVLVPGPAGERALELSVVAEAPEPLAELRGELVVDLDPLLGWRLAEDRLVEAVQPLELRDRPLVVIDPQVDGDVGHAPVPAAAVDDEQGRRLLAAAVAARRLRGGEAREQPLGERLAGAALEGGRERVDGLAGDEDVPLDREPRSGQAARPVVAL